MEFCKSMDAGLRRTIHTYFQQQVRRSRSKVRQAIKTGDSAVIKDVIGNMKKAKKTPVYLFKATVAGVKGFLVVSAMEATKAGLKVSKAEYQFGEEQADQCDVKSFLQEKAGESSGM